MLRPARDKSGFVFAPHHAGHTRQTRQFVRRAFRRATHQVNHGGGRRPVQTSGHGPRIGYGIGGHRASVDDNDPRAVRLRGFGKSGRGPGLAQGLAFVLIDLAAQADDMESPVWSGVFLGRVQLSLFCLLFLV